MLKGYSRKATAMASLLVLLSACAGGGNISNTSEGTTSNQPNVVKLQSQAIGPKNARPGQCFARIRNTGVAGGQGLAKDIVLLSSIRQNAYSPPQFQAVEERIIIREGYRVWKPGGRAYAVGTNALGGRILRNKHTLDGIFCLVEVAPIYGTIEKQILVEPAKFGGVAVDHGRNIDWIPVICAENATRDFIKTVQRELKVRGYYSGSINGVSSPAYFYAIGKFQAKHRIPANVLTIEGARLLGIA